MPTLNYYKKPSRSLKCIFHGFRLEALDLSSHPNEEFLEQKCFRVVLRDYEGCGTAMPHSVSLRPSLSPEVPTK